MAPPTTAGRGKEKFVQWKEPARVEPGQENSGRGTSSSGTSRGGRGRTPITSARGPTKQPPPSRTERVPGSVTNTGNERRAVPSVSLLSGRSEHDDVTPEAVSKRNSVLSGSSAPEGSRQRQVLSSPTAVPVRNLRDKFQQSTHSGGCEDPHDNPENDSTGREGVFTQVRRGHAGYHHPAANPAGTQRTPSVMSGQRDAYGCEEGTRRSTMTGQNAGLPGDQRRIPTAVQGGTERQRSEDHLVNGEDVEDVAAITTPQTQGRVAPNFSFYNDDNVDMVADSAEEEEEEDQDGCPMEDSGYDYPNSSANVEDSMYQTETEKQRERRHELAARRREGDRRHAEGLPRNYLLVDKYSNEPYGQGVGSWRKELMLLSRDLDPSIGNINRQPEDKVKEIAKWIQHTWEYERPIRWEFVKEVIARGVTLRRAELWKRIRLKQPQPEGLNDRIWRSLERQLRSPAMTLKFENCSKANACRQNFGRMGPSGEVGVRERLRKQFKRSPSPTEIRREMARPKGYAGRSKRHLQLLNIMHGSVDEGTTAENRRSTTDLSEANGDCPADNNPEGGGTEEGNDSVDGITADKDGGRTDFTASQVLTLSENQVSQHPAFVCIMKRLEALERMANNSAVAVDVEEDGHNSNPSGQETAEEVQVENQVLLHFGFAVMSDMENAAVVVATPAGRKRGRPRKKPQQ